MFSVDVIDNPGGQWLLTTEDGYTYKMTTVTGPPDSRRVYVWTCSAPGCKARLRTVVVARKHVVVREAAATPGVPVVHDHRSSPIRDMFTTVGHASGNVYLPPTLWRRE